MPRRIKPEAGGFRSALRPLLPGRCQRSVCGSPDRTPGTWLSSTPALHTDSKRGVAEGPQIVVVDLIVEAGGSEPYSRSVLDEGPQVVTAQWIADSAEPRRQGTPASTWSIVGTGGAKRAADT